MAQTIKPKLTKRQSKFVDAMVDPQTKSQTEAAKKAGYAKNRLRQTAHETVTKSYIQEAIKNRKAKLAQLAEVTEKEVMGATVEIAFASIEDALDDDGNLDFAKAKENGSVSLIKKITRNPTKYGETVSVEFYPKDAAQTRLGEYLGMKTQDKKNPQDIEAIARAVLGAIKDGEVADIIYTMRRQFPADKYPAFDVEAFLRAEMPEAVRERES